MNFTIWDIFRSVFDLYMELGKEAMKSLSEAMSNFTRRDLFRFVFDQSMKEAIESLSEAMQSLSEAMSEVTIWI